MGTLNPGDVAGDGPLVEEGIWKTGLIVASPVNIMYISKVDYDRCARPALRKYWDRIDSTLRGLIALEGCSEEEFQEMKKSMAIRRVDAGTVLCAEGLYVNEVMVICMGFAQVYKDTETTTIPRNILVLQNQAYAMRMRKWDNAVLVGEAWRGELIDPNAVFNRQTASMSVVAASVLDVIVLPWGEASRIFNGDARQKFLRLSPTFPSGADLQKRILDVAKWRTYSRNLVQSVLKESKFASRLIGPELPLSSACAYNSLPVIGKISPSPGMVGLSFSFFSHHPDRRSLSPNVWSKTPSPNSTPCLCHSPPGASFLWKVFFVGRILEWCHHCGAATHIAPNRERTIPLPHPPAHLNSPTHIPFHNRKPDSI